VRRIEGDFFNVMGFPIQRFLEVLARFGLAYDFRTIVRTTDRG
jgi:predicted house-cleaning NTP pyrophosphatase (Maf/HAM1 superfamily)